MREFTKTEINLCKKIAEKEQDWSRVDWGSFVLYKNKVQVVINYSKSPNLPVINLADDKDHQDQIYNVLKLLPLWQEHDCLEFLRRKPDLHYLAIHADYLKLEWHVELNLGKGYKGQSILEALLNAVLAVMEGK